jgi:hypothetical protein
VFSIGAELGQGAAHGAIRSLQSSSNDNAQSADQTTTNKTAPEAAAAQMTERMMPKLPHDDSGIFKREISGQAGLNSSYCCSGALKIRQHRLDLAGFEPLVSSGPLRPILREEAAVCAHVLHVQ